MSDSPLDEYALESDTVEEQEEEEASLEAELEADQPISSEEELIESPGVPLPTEVATTEENEEAHLTALVCDSCLELNLLTKSAIECVRCGKAFCLHYASSVDALYCVNCLSDISVTKQVITKTYERRNEETKEVSTYRRRARAIKIEGLDWLFAQRKIVTLADVELDLAIEYHRNICGLMIAESERRRNDKMHRYAGMTVKLPSTPATTKVTDNTTTTVKKTRTISKNKAHEQVAAILSALQAKGMTMEQITALLNKK